MPSNELFGPTIDLLAKNIDLRAKKHSYIASNIANAETPHYSSKTFSFEDQLKDSIENREVASGNATPANPRHIPIKRVARRLEDVEGTVRESAPSSGSGRDGNTVDLEREMASLAENQILFDASVQILSKKFDGLKYAIKGGS